MAWVERSAGPVAFTIMVTSPAQGGVSDGSQRERKYLLSALCAETPKLSCSLSPLSEEQKNELLRRLQLIEARQISNGTSVTFKQTNSNDDLMFSEEKIRSIGMAPGKHLGKVRRK